MSYSSIVEIKKLSSEYMMALQSCDLVTYGIPMQHAALNAQATNDRLLQAIFFGATNNLAKAKLPEARYEDRSSGSVQVDISSRELKYFDLSGRVFVHPSSVSRFIQTCASELNKTPRCYFMRPRSDLVSSRSSPNKSLQSNLCAIFQKSVIGGSYY